MILPEDLEVYLKVARHYDVVELTITPDRTNIKFREVATQEPAPIKLPEKMPNNQDFMFMASGLEPVSLTEAEEETHEKG